MSSTSFPMDQYGTIFLSKNGDDIRFSTYPYHPIINEASRCDTREKILFFLQKIQKQVPKTNLDQKYHITHHNNDEYKGHEGDKKSVSHECSIDKMISFVELMISKEKKK